MSDEKTTPEEAQADVFAPESATHDPNNPEVGTSAPDRDETADHDPDVSFESIGAAFAAVTDGPDAVDETAPPQYGVGPFSIREVALGGVWLLAFIFSFFPIYGQIGNGVSTWNGIDWVLTIGVPTVAVFLIGLRRLSPQGIRRVGSLGIDQFASVAFSVSTVVWLGMLWNSFVTLAGSRVFYATWVVWIEFILMLAGVFLTVLAPLFPTIGDDFRHRAEIPAHRFASPARPVIPRPATARPATQAEPATAAPVATATPGDDQVDAASPLFEAGETQVFDVLAEEEHTPVTAPATQAFWALAPVERDVVDDAGETLFTVGPTAWALVIEDRGDSFVVRHEDGRIGSLRDISGVTRG
ncbi:hypothetical protein [uncultured Microbacterium sp.]|uniref:hypothetical protein n=1 Tax=uncultured Microbacterium sp. TaxID=191216 RepID=UPI0026177212|nr:hypothetical protein [uncultured Microbacterium sp.]